MERKPPKTLIYVLPIGLFYLVWSFSHAHEVKQRTYIVDDDFNQSKYTSVKKLDAGEQMTIALKNLNQSTKRDKIRLLNVVKSDTEAQKTIKNARIEEEKFRLLKVR
jgi:hypothetical protein